MDKCAVAVWNRACWHPQRASFERTTESDNSFQEGKRIMTTGQDAPELGLYASDCCDYEMIFEKGDLFCRCPDCERFCEWDLVEIVIPWNEIRPLRAKAA
jgi:hypothetical protein